MINANCQKYKKIFLAIYFIILFAWLLFIFSNSMSTGIESDAQSDKVVKISQKIVSVFDKDAVVEPSVVRTSAHFFEFFVLGLLYYAGTYFFNNRRHMLLLMSLGLSLFTALVDETLQLNVAGRGAEVTDIWVDFLGAVCSHFVVIFIITFVRLVKKK